MKKKVVSVLLAVSMVAALAAGCGKGKPIRSGIGSYGLVAIVCNRGFYKITNIFFILDNEYC